MQTDTTTPKPGAKPALLFAPDIKAIAEFGKNDDYSTVIQAQTAPRFDNTPGRIARSPGVEAVGCSADKLFAAVPMRSRNS